MDNRIVSITLSQPRPALPEGVLPFANLGLYTDVDPYEVVRFIKEGVLEVRGLDATLDPTWKPEQHVGGFAAHTSNNREQRYSYASNEAYGTKIIRLSKAAKNPAKRGRWFDKHGNRYALSAEPYKFHDYNF